MSQPTIGVLTEFVGGFFYRPILTGIHAAAQQRNFQVITFQTLRPEINGAQLARETIDGWLILAEAVGLDALLATGVPALTVNTVLPGGRCPAALPDNAGGARAVVEHLIGHGHEHIAYLGPLQIGDIVERFASYQATLVEHGLAVNPALWVDVGEYSPAAAQRAAAELLARGAHFTALTVGTDQQALAVIEYLQGEGLRVPEDVAVVGFDDIAMGQRSQPSLTTVRQPFDLLGRLALDLLGDMITTGQPAPPLSLVPTPLVVRRSCGCDLITARTLDRTPLTLDGATSAQQLAGQLVEVLDDVASAAPGATPGALWPGVATLIEGLAAALDRRAGPSRKMLEQAWRQATTLTSDLEAWSGVLTLLERTGQATQTVNGGGPAVAAHLAAFLRTARLALMQARVGQEQRQSRYLESLVQTTYATTQTLLSDETALMTLPWLAYLPVSWGALALWQKSASGERTLVIHGLFTNGPTPSLALGLEFRPAAFPPRLALAPDEHRSDILALFPVRTMTFDWGMLVISGPFSQWMRSDEENWGLWATLLGAMLDRRLLQDSQQAQQATLQAAYERERALADTVRELSSPVIPLLPGVLLVPLIGALHEGRAGQLIDAVLSGVSAGRAHTVLLDVTGVAIVDTHVANALIGLSQAVALLGARLTLVGIRPRSPRAS